jgi:nucleoside-diphosphate-sugar epimerase
MSERILVIGAAGQIGTELTAALVQQHGRDAVIATDVRPQQADGLRRAVLDVMDANSVLRVVADESITQIYLLAAALSATGENDPARAWRLNMDGLVNVLEAARTHGVRQVFWPSSIAVFGPGTPRHNTPQDALTEPSTIYGISKLAGERLCAYYWQRYGLDVRSLRYPGLISYQTPPGGGTTDYAIDIFHHAVRGDTYTCFLQEDATLPMMYMEDAVKATLDLMAAPASALTVRTSYNVTSLSFSPAELAAAIAARVPGFTVRYAPDARQAIAASWPASLSDEVARNDWQWSPRYDLEAMVDDMLAHIPAPKVAATA